MMNRYVRGKYENDNSRKRKLSYDDKKESLTRVSVCPGARHSCSTPGWENFGDGFSSSTPSEARGSKTPKHPKINKISKIWPAKTIISSFNDFSEEQPTVDDEISWNSSPSSSDSERRLEKVKPKRDTVKKKGCQKKSFSATISAQVAAGIDITESDDESSFVSGAVKFPQKNKGQSLEVTIQGYDSTEENRVDPDYDQYKVQSLPTDSPSISGSSTPSFSGQSGQRKLTASDWVRNLKLLTPQKPSELGQSENAQEDSAKKRKSKYVRGGFADQLHRLQMREKSDIRMWNHQQMGKVLLGSQENPKVMVIKILGFEMLFSLRLARCTVLTPDFHDTSCIWKILFSGLMAENPDVEIGTIIQIHPPWRELCLKGDEKSLLLSINYCRIIGKDGETMGCTLAEKSYTEKCVKMKWRCPCSSRPSLQVSLCPAYLHPCSTGAPPSDLQVSAERSCESTASDLGRDTVLYTVTPHWTAPIMSDSLLDGVERAGIKHNGSICFKGHVHRVVQRNSQLQSDESFYLIVEDGHGAVCKVQVGKQRDSDTDVFKIEGRSLLLSNLYVQTRMNRDRDPNLFSLIDSVWSGIKAPVTSQSTEDSQSAQITTSEPQPLGFCYILKSDTLSLAKLSAQEMQPALCSFKQQVLDPLSKVMANPSPCLRVSFVGRVIFFEHIKPDLSTRRLYITDPSLSDNRIQQKYVIVHIKHQCCFGQNRLERDKDVLLCRDIIVENGSYHADCYSSFFSHPNGESPSKGWINWKPFSLREYETIRFLIPDLVLEDEPGSIVSIAGRIASVDEGSAYSWEVCEHCGGEDLKSTTRNMLCGSCGQDVLAPVTKMKMEVFIQSPLIDHRKGSIKIDLLESTIQGLLPIGEQTNEGYELSSIINKRLVPLDCLLLSKTSKHGQNLLFLKQITLLQ